jgi:hypothetical protein
MASMIGGIVSVTLGAVMLANVFISQIKATNTDSWSTAETSLWDILTIAGVIGLVVGVLNVFGII